MMLHGPHRAVGDPDRLGDCVEELGLLVAAMHERLHTDGYSEVDAAMILLRSVMFIENGDAISDELRAIVEWAVEAGWEKQEAEQALVLLAWENLTQFDVPDEDMAEILKVRGRLN